MTGDALGMGVEGWPWERIKARYGWLEEMKPNRFPAGWYTDDSQMAIGLLESLVEANGFDPARCAARWLANYEPQRGYGGRIHGVMARLARGEDWSKVGTDSFGNGAAMRIAPLGLWLARDEAALKKAALTSAQITHHHPEAKAGAVVQALGVAQALAWGLEGETVDPSRFVRPLIEAAAEVDGAFAGRLEPLAELAKQTRTEARARLTGLFACDVKAIEAVPPAVGAFLATDSFRDALTLAVNLGGDVDTIGAMAGAMAGAYYGAGAIPEEWWQALENEPGSGRDYVVQLCLKAARLVERP